MANGVATILGTAAVGSILFVGYNRRDGVWVHSWPRYEHCADQIATSTAHTEMTTCMSKIVTLTAGTGLACVVPAGMVAQIGLFYEGYTMVKINVIGPETFTIPGYRHPYTAGVNIISVSSGGWPFADATAANDVCQ